MALTSLRVRLVTATVVITGLLTVAVIVLLQVNLERQSSADSADLARARLDAAASAVVVEGGTVRDLRSGGKMLDRDVWIFDTHGVMLDGNIPANVAGPAGQLAASQVDRIEKVSEQTLLASRVIRDGDTTAGVIVAGVDLTPYESNERRSLLLAVLLGLFSVLAAAVAASEAARFTLGRVHHMVAQAQAWEEHDLDQRFGLGAPRDAFSELGHTLNHMLNRIAAALRSERRLTDELAHELSTPLTVIRGEAELALATAVDPAPLEAIIAEVRRAESAMASMLDAARARIDEQATSDVGAVLRAMGGRAVTVTSPVSLSAGVDEATLRALLTPLIDNAWRHAATQVSLAAEESAGRVLITVADDGPGVPEADLERIFEPGRSGAQPGSAGLGLAVVRRLAHAVGGEVRALPGPGGRFEVSIPGD
jgi:two-component system, OmpR family, sensor kinase